MAKAKVVKAVTTKATTKAKPDGSPENPFPWVEPYPKAVMDKDDPKVDKVFVRATAKQALGINGAFMQVGPVTLPCSYAHAHASALGPPVEG